MGSSDIGWRVLLVAVFGCLAVMVPPAFGADTIEEWDPGFTDWEYYFTYDGLTAEKFSEFVIGAGTGVGETLSLGLVGGLDHNNTEAGVLTALGITAFYRFSSISEKYGVDFDLLADFGWEEAEAEFEFHLPAGGVDGTTFVVMGSEDVYVWDVGVEVSYPTERVTPYMRAFVIDNDVNDLVTGHFTIANLLTVIPDRMEFLVEWDIETMGDADAQHSIGLGLNTFFWFWETDGNEHDIELIPEARYFFENDELENGFWALTIGLIMTW